MAKKQQNEQLKEDQVVCKSKSKHRTGTEVSVKNKSAEKLEEEFNGTDACNSSNIQKVVITRIAKRKQCKSKGLEEFKCTRKRRHPGIISKSKPGCKKFRGWENQEFMNEESSEETNEMLVKMEEPDKDIKIVDIVPKFDYVAQEILNSNEFYDVDFGSRVYDSDDDKDTTLCSDTEDCKTLHVVSDKFLELFPPGTKVIKINGTVDNYEAIVRCTCKDKEDFLINWLAPYQDLSNQVFRILVTRPRSGFRVVYKAAYRCERNTYPDSHRKKKPADQIKGRNSKHTDCKAMLLVTIQAPPRTYRSRPGKDIFRFQYPTRIQIKHTHNHVPRCDDKKSRRTGEPCSTSYTDYDALYTPETSDREKSNTEIQYEQSPSSTSKKNPNREARLRKNHFPDEIYEFVNLDAAESDVQEEPIIEEEDWRPDPLCLSPRRSLSPTTVALKPVAIEVKVNPAEDVICESFMDFISEHRDEWDNDGITDHNNFDHNNFNQVEHIELTKIGMSVQIISHHQSLLSLQEAPRAQNDD